MGETKDILIIIAFNLFFILFLLSIVLFIRQYFIKKKEYESKLELSIMEHKKELLNTEVEIQFQTMQNIGREIHDNIGQKLTLASLNLQKIIFENENLENLKEIKDINNILNSCLNDLRGLSKSLTDNHVLNNGFFELVEKEIKKIEYLKPIKINFYCPKEIQLEYTQKMVFYRITQEFFQNSIKHSECSQIQIELDNLPNQLIFKLKDNGKGFDVSRSDYAGIGLKNMKKRTEIIGGDFTIKSSNLGTEILIIINKSNL